MSRKPAIPEKTGLEAAAVACCRRVYGRKCPCKDAPSVCLSMRGAALAAISTVAPDLAEKLIKEATS